MPLRKKASWIIITLLLLLSSIPSIAQSDSAAVKRIEAAIAAKQYRQATELLQKQVADLTAKNNMDSLASFIHYAGTIEADQNGIEAGIRKAQQLISKIKANKLPARSLRKVYIEAAYFYGVVERPGLAYASLQQAYIHTKQMKEASRNLFARLESDLGAYAQRTGDLHKSQEHHRRALAIYLSLPKPDQQSLYVCYNNMGSIMWYASKTDSAMYYFKLALETLKKTPRNPENMYYRAAIVENNIAALYGMKGKTTESIEAMKSCIRNIRRFLDTKEYHFKKATAMSFQFQAIDNLGAIYRELGDFKQAEALLQYSYRQKVKDLDPNHPAIFESQILVGQLYFDMREYTKALRFLTEGLGRLTKADGDHTYWHADASHTLAMMHDHKGDKTRAAHYYEKADSLYQLSFQGDYDNIYLGFLKNISLFYAENGQSKLALAKARKGYNYIIKNQGGNTLSAFYQTLNMSEIFFILKDYKESLKYSQKGLAIVNENIRSSENLMDSIKIELKKPKAILMRAKAEHELMQKKDVPHLSGLLKELSEALTLLEKRKLVIGEAENMSLLMEDHKDLMEFGKKIIIDLYALTKNESYVDQLISLHESGMYNRIRSRLDKNDSLPFAHISAEAQATERRLKGDISRSLQGERSHDEKMQAHFVAIDKWNKFKDELRQKHPVYYKMRYGSIFKSSAEVQQSIPEQSTVIRYLFVGENLYALVIDRSRKQIFSLESEGLDDFINDLAQYKLNEQQVTEILYTLHQQLWAPLKDAIGTERVTVIPDGILYNLSFETLTSQRLKSYKEFAAHSLLAKHAITYHYSLFLLQPRAHSTRRSDNFVAFAPGFSEELKNEYRQKITDSIDIDNEYLHLLPQPFTVSLAKKTKRLLGGSLFLNNTSTERSFKKNAGRHDIIHIGTHAESNNTHPEFSKLIFAKTSGSSEDDNSLFLSEIYNCDLTSNLTVLTACETGKPGKEDGEGMISLAHAFNFAGSESILMGLWKIDEKSSAVIVESFYENLVEGMTKDEALRQAKLAYLQQARGTTLDPAYWAGLVLMGNPAPLELQPKRTMAYVGLGVLLLLGGAVWMYRRSTRNGKIVA